MGAARTPPYHPLSPYSLQVCVRDDKTLVLVTLREKKTGCQQASMVHIRMAFQSNYANQDFHL